jgi:uncharacterized membrane protein
MAITNDHSFYTTESTLDDHSQVVVRKVGTAAPIEWLQKGWNDFYAIPALSLLYGLMAVSGCYLVYLYSRESLPLALGLFSGLLLIGPFVATGLYVAARNLEAGYPATIFQSIRSIARAGLRIGIIAMFLSIIMIAWLRVSSVLIALHYAAFQPDSLQIALRTMDWNMLLVLGLYLLIGFVFAVLVFVTNAIALPMILDKDCDPITAIHGSIRAVNRNRKAMALWAGLITLAALASIATAFIGFAVLFPVLGYATWHSYRDLVE